jgi:hypothetical protein
MKYPPRTTLGIIFLIMIILISACERQNTVCSPLDGTPQPKPALADLIAMEAPEALESPLTIEIGGKMRTVDKLVDYAICNDEWQGIVYVGCDAQVAQAQTDSQDNPLFFKGCDLKIEPGTVVYVAAHNDAAYYKGCSCHTGQDPIP